MTGQRLTRRNALAGAILVAAGGGLAFGLYDFGAPADAADILSAPDAAAAVAAQELILIDVRRPDEWRATGVAQGAYAIDMRNDDFIDRVLALANAAPGVPVAFICARGVRSARMRRTLAAAGLDPALDISEGMLGSRNGPGWLSRGLPTVPAAEALRG